MSPLYEASPAMKVPGGLVMRMWEVLVIDRVKKIYKPFLQTQFFLMIAL